jgi:hypothetical protein
MPIYRFRILGRSDQVIAGQYSHCKDDDAARQHADILAAQRRYSNIVIWDDDRQVPPRPRLMVRPPEGLALSRPRSVLARHLALLNLQNERENRSRPRPSKQACERWSLTDPE